MYYLCIRLQINISVLFFLREVDGGGRGWEKSVRVKSFCNSASMYN